MDVGEGPTAGAVGVMRGAAVGVGAAVLTTVGLNGVTANAVRVGNREGLGVRVEGDARVVELGRVCDMRVGVSEGRSDVEVNEGNKV